MSADNQARGGLSHVYVPPTWTRTSLNPTGRARVLLKPLKRAGPAASNKTGAVAAGFVPLDGGSQSHIAFVQGEHDAVHKSLLAEVEALKAENRGRC